MSSRAGGKRGQPTPSFRSSEDAWLQPQAGQALGPGSREVLRIAGLCKGPRQTDVTQMFELQQGNGDKRTREGAKLHFFGEHSCLQEKAEL